MNWGTKLIIGTALLMSFIITLAVLMIRNDSDDFIDANYYEKGIEYDKDYERKNQLIEDKAEPKISPRSSIVMIPSIAFSIIAYNNAPLSVI